MNTVAQRSAHSACSNLDLCPHSHLRSSSSSHGLSSQGQNAARTPHWYEPFWVGRERDGGKKDGDGGLGSDWSSVGRGEEWTALGDRPRGRKRSRLGSRFLQA